LAKKSAKSKSKSAPKTKPVAKKALAKSGKKPALKAKPKAKIVVKSKKTSAKVMKAPAKKAISKAKAGKSSSAKVPVKAKVVVEAAARFSCKQQASKTTKTENLNAIFSPLDDRIIVEEVKAALRTSGGLYIPDTALAPDGPKHGKVLAVGRGHADKKGRLRPLDVKLGDTVVFESYLGHALKIGDRECVVLRESQLLGVVNN
jgi:chaperonin GroES